MQMSTGNKLASRRFILVVFGVTVASLLMYSGKINGVNYENLMIWITGIYIVGRPMGDFIGNVINRVPSNENIKK